MRTLKVLSLAATVLLAAAPAAGSAVPPPSCNTGGLVIWVTNGNGAAGSIYYQLELTNQSGHTCTLRGFPGVAAVNLDGHQLGRAASHTPGKVKTVALKNNDSATATLRIVQAGNFPAAKCGVTDAAGLRIHPPGQRAAKTVPLPFLACSRTAETFLSVQPVR